MTDWPILCEQDLRQLRLGGGQTGFSNMSKKTIRKIPLFVESVEEKVDVEKNEKDRFPIQILDLDTGAF